VIFGFLSAS